MNTKGIKFLAVLAVMVMAFAAIVALAPADNDSNAVVVFNDDSVVRDPTVIDDTVTAAKFYISDDATVKIKDIKASSLTFYVQNGKELELDFKQAAATTSYTPKVDKSITIYTVTADQQRVTTSTVDLGNAGGEDGTVKGKIILMDTEFTFTGADKQNIAYTALMPVLVETITTSGYFVTEVDTMGYFGNYAYISASDVLAGVEVGSYVAVAKGQSIESGASIDNLNYGVEVASVEDAAVIHTYYAIGMNAGAVTIESEREYVTVLNGTVTVNNGTASVRASSAIAGASAIELTYADKDMIAVSGVLSSGSMTVSGKVQFPANGFTVNGTLTLNASAVVDSGMVKVGDSGKLILRNEWKDKAEKLKISGTGFVVAENEKLWQYDDKNKPILKFEGGFTGQYDVSAITKNADVYDAFADATIEKNQTFTMIGDTVVANQFTIEGILVINEGVTLTVTQTNNYGASITVQGQYAQIINYGTIIIKTTVPFEGQVAGLHVLGGSVLNYGTISASSLAKAAGDDQNPATETFVVDYVDTTATPARPTALGYGFVNDGTISIGKYDTANLDSKFTNNGSVSVVGSLIADSFVNGGLFTLNNAKVTTGDDGKFTVTMTPGAELKISAVDVAPGVEIIIQNDLDDSDPAVPANYISVTAPGNYSANATDSEVELVRITGITVTDTSTFLVSKLDLSGNIGTKADVADPAILATKGYIDVSGIATIGKGYALDFSVETILDVSGDFTVSKDVTAAVEDPTAATPALLDMNLFIIATGTVTDVPAILDAGYVGAKYELSSGAVIYTNLADAIPAAVQAEVANIEVGDDKDAGYYVTIDDDLVIPEGLTIDGKFIVIDDMATVVVQAGARFSFTQVVVENGMITAEDVNDIDYEAILADVKEQDDESTAAACMSLEVALMFATPGDVITLANPYYTADANLVIPEGVTVDATKVEGTEWNFTMVNSNLTVDGKLIVDQFAFVATTDDTISITVNGFIYDECTTGACFVPWWYNPFGVSYPWTDDEDHTWFVITNIGKIQEAIDEADDAEVTVQGDAKLDELNVHGRDDMPATVNFTGDVEIGVINIDDTTLNFTDGKKISTTVKDALGSITIIGAYSDRDLSIFSLDDKGVYMDGVVTDTATPKIDGSSTSTYSIRFDGITGMDGSSRAAIDWTNDEKAPSILFAGETTVIGKKAYINYDDETGAPGIATITGLLYVDSGARLTINASTEVLGGLVAAERTEESVPGTIDTNGNIFIGMLMSDIYDFSVIYVEPEVATGADAYASGKISLAQGCFIYLASGATVDPAIVEDLDTLNIYVDSELWFTLFGYENDDWGLDYLKVPMFNADLAIVLDGYEEAIACMIIPTTRDVIYQLEDDRTISEYGNAIYIGLNYNIFDVKIKTDGSVKAVYIDGILMETGNVANIFTMKDVAAGTHKVTVEAATGYDADKCVLYTELGTILPGMAFTFTEYDCTEVSEDGAPTVVYNINGTEIQPEPVPPTPEEESQWTITTILLVILVVLIAIMAVIVALRLNRS